MGTMLDNLLSPSHLLLCMSYIYTVIHLQSKGISLALNVREYGTQKTTGSRSSSSGTYHLSFFMAMSSMNSAFYLGGWMKVCALQLERMT